VAFNLIRKALKPGGQLLLAADPTQGFLRRRLSWSGMGIDVRGRSHNLTICYRTTRGILEFAASFYKNRLPEEDVEVFLPGKSVLQAMDTGKSPLMEIVKAPQDERAMVMMATRKMIDEGARPGDILILHANSMAVRNLVTFLRDKMKDVSVVNLRDKIEVKGNEVRVCSLEAATGLEAPVVMVLGIDTLLQKEDDPRMPTEERDSLVKNNTKRLYMAFTRAAARLIVFLPQSLAERSWFVSQPDFT
jgi:DNA helicase IV